jgi:type I restriction enzyme, S subunit
MTWSKATLGNIADEVGGSIQTGPFGSQLHQSDYQSYGTPVVMPQNIVNDRITEDSIAYIDDVMVGKLSRHVLQVGDIVYPRRGELNKRAIISERESGWLCGTGCVKISLPNSPLVPSFLFYYLKQSQVVKWIENKAVGSTMLNLNTGILRSLEVQYPNYQTQQRIADILSNYDRLIDNNNRRIALLEESIHKLYKEWFVHLHFPGYESVKVVDGIPEGWRNSTISDAFTIIGGGTPSKNIQEYWQDGTITWYSPTDLTKANTMFMEKSGSQITSVGLANSSARLFPPFSVMMTSRATIGVVSINTTEACTNQGFITCIPNEKIPLYFLYCWIKANTEIFYNLASGATFKEISKGIFKKIPIIIPDAAIINKFEDKAKAYGSLILILQKENQYLYESRDLLLPRLMNGSIAV